MTTNKKWYPVKVKPQSEFNAFSFLIKNGLKAYLPLMRIPANKDKWKLKPLFRGKLFIYCDNSEIIRVEKMLSSVSFYHNKNKTIEIDDKYIMLIKNITGSNDNFNVQSKKIDAEENILLNTKKFGTLQMNINNIEGEQRFLIQIPVVNQTIIFNYKNNFVKGLLFENMA